jgi:uncharacterized protein YjbI with pentapeptide repeats
MAEKGLSGYTPVDDTGFEARFGRKPRRNQAQYDLLHKCSKKEDMTEWNEWREKRPGVEVWLEAWDLQMTFLSDANLAEASLLASRLPKANLAHASLILARLDRADLEGAVLVGAHMENAVLRGAHMEYAVLVSAHMNNAVLTGAHMENAVLTGAHLEGATLVRVDLQGAHLDSAHIEQSKWGDVDLRGASFIVAVVDGGTAFAGCAVDKNTNFSGVAMGSCLMQPGLKETLEYNIRRMRYRNVSFLKWIRNVPANFFWFFSDYGRSTWKLIRWFSLLSLAFAVLYYHFEFCRGEPLVQGLSTVIAPLREPDPITPHWWSVLVLVRAFYFSIVTMTTLGFGDLSANPESFLGYVVLAVHVILGYVLLGALICRFSITFQSQGPPVPLSPRWKPQKKKRALERQPEEYSADGDPAA